MSENSHEEIELSEVLIIIGALATVFSFICLLWQHYQVTN